jgi:membrane-bound serine protease (ClpP class)
VGVIGTVAVISGVLIVTTAGVALRSRRRKVVSGVDSLVGTIAQVLDDAPDDSPRAGWANAGGETWRVESQLPLRRGQHVRIVRRRGSALEVVPIDKNEKGEPP